MKTYDVEVTLKVTISVEARNQASAKEQAMETAESGYFENGIDSIKARVLKG